MVRDLQGRETPFHAQPGNGTCPPRSELRRSYTLGPENSTHAVEAIAQYTTGFHTARGAPWDLYWRAIPGVHLEKENAPEVISAGLNFKKNSWRHAPSPP